MIFPILFWNVRGIGNLPTKWALRHMVKKFHIPILAISELKISLDAAGAIRQYFHMQDFAGNEGEGSKI